MQRATRTEDISRVLREEVLRGQYRPGERLPSERDLAARFETTRGVVRVALKRLEQLGVAEVQPGGARVCPISDASLDVVGHLLDLEQTPDPRLVDQILEVVGALAAATTRIAVERGEPEHLERARCLIARLRDPGLSQDERFALVHELGETFLDASDNLVLRLVRRGLRTRFFDRLHELGGGLQPEPALLEPIVGELAGALEKRDPAAADNAVHRLWRVLRERMRESLEAARSARANGGPQS